MGCRLGDFTIGTKRRLAPRLETADATTGPLSGVVYWIDGIFQGFTGNDDAAIYHFERRTTAESKKRI